jgi:hypothetical protein
METRVVPSALGLHAPVLQTVNMHVAQLQARKEQTETTKTAELRVRLHHRDLAKSTAAAKSSQTEAHHQGRTTTSSNPITSFFNSIFKNI